MKSFKTFIESKASDAYEIAAANYINSFSGISAERPKVGTQFSDVRFWLDDKPEKDYWLEVKMNLSDNLGNPRFDFDGTRWLSRSSSPISDDIATHLNGDKDVKALIKNMTEQYNKIEGLNLKTIKLLSTKAGVTQEDQPNFLNFIHEYFNNIVPTQDINVKNRNIMMISDYDIGSVVTSHYEHKDTYYLQAGDNFYLIGDSNPLNLPSDVPKIKGKNKLIVRVSTRSEFFEIQAEIKLKDWEISNYSLKPGTSKLNPLAQYIK